MEQFLVVNNKILEMIIFVICILYTIVQLFLSPLS